MVRKASEETGVKTRGTTAMASWEKQLEADAAVAVAQESLTGGGQFIGLRSGIMTFNGEVMPNNELHCVILDNIFENVYYEDDYDSDNPGAPRCFAYGRFDPATKKVLGVDCMEENTADGGMAPHKSVLRPVHTDCASCPMNQFGTSKSGRGKACSNRRRLALIPVAGSTKKGRFVVNTGDTDHYQTASIAYLKTPVTSSKIFGDYQKQVGATVKRPLYAVFSRVFVTPGGDNQFAVNYECIDNAPAALGKILLERRSEAEVAILFPYTQLVDDGKKVARGKGDKGDKGAKAPAKAPTKAPAKAPAKKPAGRNRY